MSDIEDWERKMIEVEEDEKEEKRQYYLDSIDYIKKMNCRKSQLLKDEEPL
jgi:hypothetical protein